MIPGELTEAVRTVTRAFGDESTTVTPATGQSGEAATADDHTAPGDIRTPQLEAGSMVSLDAAAAAADEAGKQAAAAVSDAKAEAEAAKSAHVPPRAPSSKPGIS